MVSFTMRKADVCATGQMVLRQLCTQNAKQVEAALLRKDGKGSRVRGKGKENTSKKVSPQKEAH
jgi:hypothetical protein